MVKSSGVLRVKNLWGRTDLSCFSAYSSILILLTRSFFRFSWPFLSPCRNAIWAWKQKDVALKERRRDEMFLGKNRADAALAFCILISHQQKAWQLLQADSYKASTSVKTEIGQIRMCGMTDNKKPISIFYFNLPPTHRPAPLPSPTAVSLQQLLTHSLWVSITL